jgi:outer membrane autotransporter protein
MNKNRSILRSTLSPSFTLAALAACSFVSSSLAGNITPPPGDWYQDGFDNWHLDDPLVGDSQTLGAKTPFAELAVADSFNATIDSDGSWETDIDGFAGIAFDTEGTLTLDGDLTFINDGDDDDDGAPIRVGVLFEEGGELAGDSALTVESSSSDLTLLLAGVVSDGSLDITDFTGSVEVTNDNSGGLSDASDDFDLGGLLGDIEIDIESSAAAIGIAAVDVDALGDFIGNLDLSALAGAFLGPQITGELTQKVTVVAESNDVISTTATEDSVGSGAVDAVVFAASVGVAGNLTDGINGADVSSTATGGSVTALSTVGLGDDDDDDDDALAATLALAVGVAGGADLITGDTSITAVATADDASATIVVDVLPIDGDDDATAISIAAAVGVAGLVGDIDGGDDATVTISADATTQDTTANAIDFATSINAAIALGLGAGIEGSINGAEISATAETGDADATAAADSFPSESDALNIAGAVALGGIVGGDISGSTLTASAETGDATADETYGDASATTMAVSAGVIGAIQGTVTDTTITATSFSGDAEAVSDNSDVSANSLSFAAGILGSVHAVSDEDGDVIINVSATSGDADASTSSDDDDADAVSSAYAYGIADFEAIGSLLQGLPDILGGMGGIAPDPIESDDPYTTTELAGTITVDAIAGNATAYADDDDDDDDSFASADAGATGFVGDITGDVSATIVTTATAGEAEATTDLDEVDAEATANAYATGIDGGIYASELGDDDDDIPIYSGSITATANAGTATAEAFDQDGDDEDEASANAESLGVVYLAGTMDGDITSNANGGTASADGGNTRDVYADGKADAYGMNRLEGDMTATASIDATAIGGEATATTSRDDDNGDAAYASTHTDAYGIESGIGTLDSILEGIDPLLSQISGEITATATAGISIADAYGYGDADAEAHAYGVHTHDSIVADFTSDFVSTSTAQGGEATADGGESADAYAEAEAGALMHSNRFEGDFGGAVTADATGGIAEANAYESEYAYADAEAGAYGIGMGDDDDDDDDSVTGDFTADVTVTATAGSAAADGGYYSDSYAGARSAGIDSAGSFTGEFGGSVDAKSYGGTADSDNGDYSYADAGANAYGLDFSGGDADLYGNVSSDITLLAEAGVVADVIPDDAIEAIDADDDDDDDDASASASGYYKAYADANTRVAAVSDVDDFTGDFSSTVDTTSTAGSADADAWSGDAYAEANAEAYGVEFYGDDDDDDDNDMFENVFSGDFTEDADVTLTATGGLATASSGDDDDDDDDDDHADAEANAFAGVMVNLERYEGDFDGTAEVLATGGDATAYGRDTASAEAYAEAVGIAIDGYEGIEFDFADDDDDDDDNVFVGNFTGSLTADAIGGDASAELDSYYSMPYDDDDDDDFEGVLADASAETIGIGGDVVGSVSGEFDLNAEGGTAEAEGFYEDAVLSLAYASVTGIAGDVYEDDVYEDDDYAIDGSSFILDATGGTAVSSVVEPMFLPGGDEVIEALFYGSSVIADASADATAVDGMVEGLTIFSTFDVTATGGTSVATNVDFGPMGSTLSIATADATGIDGWTEGFFGEMAVTAVGGTAFLENEFGMFADKIEAFEPMFGGAFADASATATGLGSGENYFYDSTRFVGDTIDVTATGGTVAVLNNSPYKVMIPNDGVESDIAIVETAYNASAQAIGIDGSILLDVMAAEITATATGGTVIIEEFGFDLDKIESESINYNADASAFAAGIAGQLVFIEDVTAEAEGPEVDFIPGITATATGGLVGSSFSSIPVDVIDGGELSEGPEIPELPELSPRSAMVGNAFAAGIMTYDYYEDLENPIEGDPLPLSSLDVTISTNVHTFVEAPEGYELENSYAAAVYSGQGDDSVELADGAYIIGDINTGGGLNEVTVTGNTIMQGNILSGKILSGNMGASSLIWIDEWLDIDNGTGTVDFDIDSGLFTAVRTVYVSDLTDSLEIAAAGGLAPILSQNQANELEDDEVKTSLISVTGETAAVNIASGAKVLPVFADGVDLNNVVGNEYTIINTEGIITDNGAIIDNSQSPFEYSLKVVQADILDDVIEGIESVPVTGDEYVLTVDRVQDQDGEQTPGSVQAAEAVSAASSAVMLDISKHASILRSVLRSSPASNGSAPTGPAAPNAGNMRNGDWLSYVSVFGNIGSQDSGNGYAGFDYDTYGLVMGMERLMGPQLILGLAGSYASTDIDGADNSGGGESDLYSAAVYVNWFTDTWYVDGGLTYGQADNDVDRIDFKGDKYRGNNDSDLFGTWVEVGYTTAHGDFGLEPYARFSYVYGEHDGYTDEGADDLVMTTDDYETDNFKTELGARMNLEWTYEDNSSFLVEVKAAWQHEWADRGVSVNSSYLGDDNLQLDSADADRDALVLGVRVEWSCSEGLSLGVEYEPTISGNWYNHAFSGTIQYNW